MTSPSVSSISNTQKYVVRPESNNRSAAQQNNAPTSNWFENFQAQNKQMMDQINKSNNTGSSSSTIPDSTTGNGSGMFEKFRKQNEIYFAGITGKPIVSYDDAGNKVNTYYDKNGNVYSKENCDATGKVTTYQVFNTDGSVKNNGTISYNSDGTSINELKDTSNKVVKRGHFRADGTTKQIDKEFDDKGRLTKYDKYDENGKLEYQDIERTYKADGTIFEHGKNVKTGGSESHQYNKDEKLTGKIISDSTGAYLYQIGYEYMGDKVRETTWDMATGQKTVKYYDKNDKEFLKQLDLTAANGSVGAWGDPHFELNGTQSFDFMGEIGGEYNMLDNNDITLIGKFGKYNNSGATIISEQNLEFDRTDINVVSHSDSTFEIYYKGEKIGDQTNYNTNADVIEKLDFFNIDLSFDKNVLTTDYNGRHLEQEMNGSYMNNRSVTRGVGDTGLLSQTAGALDKDGNIDGVSTVNNQTYNYDLANQAMVNTSVSGTKGTVNESLKAIILADYEAGLAQGSAIKGYNTSHGYNNRQWNEVIGAKLFSVDNPFL